MKYLSLVEVYDNLSSTSKRLEKTYHVSKLLSQVSTEDLATVILLLQGRIFPAHDERKIGVAAMMVQKALALCSGQSTEKISQLWKETGDLGKVAEKLMGKKQQASLFHEDLTIHEVFSTVRKLAEIEGEKSVDLKLKMIAKLLNAATPMEARYIVRTVLEDLRVGVGDGILRDAICWSFTPKILGILIPCPNCHNIVPNGETCLSCTKPLDFKYSQMLNFLTKTHFLHLTDDILEAPVKEKTLVLVPTSEEDAREKYNLTLAKVQEAYDLTNDFGKVASILKEQGMNGLNSISISVGFPLNLMLYQKANDIEEGFSVVGTPAAIEYKYDGFRMEIHKSGKKITLFTRRLEDVTDRFPDVVRYVSDHVLCNSCILDAEVIGIDPKSGKFLPFQQISRRIQRKYDIQQMAKEIPVCVNVFDILLYDNESTIKMEFKKRRDILKKVIKEKNGELVLAEMKITSSKEEAEAFYKQALIAGNEGIMMKNLEGIYQPGKRVGYGVKVKPVMETLDLVIVGAEWGEGKRAGTLTSYTLAVRDEDDNLLEIGRMSTGLKEKKTEDTDVTYEDMTNLLKEDIEAEQGKEVRVRPNLVLEVHYEEIQKSPHNSSGYALRFPRFVRLRQDRAVHEISDIALVEQLFKTQRSR